MSALELEWATVQIAMQSPQPAQSAQSPQSLEIDRRAQAVFAVEIDRRVQALKEAPKEAESNAPRA